MTLGVLLGNLYGKETSDFQIVFYRLEMNNMKNIFLIISLLFNLSSYASVTIVSDLDDTIKITEVGDLTDYLGSDIYAGMPNFFEAAKNYSDSLYILSASPKLLDQKIKTTLKKYNINYKGLILRSNIAQDKFIYKVNAIKKLMNSSSDDFIFLGDDLGKDPEVYSYIQRLYPERVLKSYIHVVKGRELNEEVVPYWTSFDLALGEFLDNRFPAASVEVIIDKLLTEKDSQLIFPRKANCPRSIDIWEWQTRTIFMNEALMLIEKFNRICKLR